MTKKTKQQYERMTPEQAKELGIDDEVLVVMQETKKSPLDSWLSLQYPDATEEELDAMARSM